MKTPRPNRRGSALIIVLWSVLLLGLAVFGVVEMVELSVEHAAYDALALDARGLAFSGVAIGLSPQLLRDDPLLFQKLPAGRQFHASIGSEGARLNLNYVLLSNQRQILETLFTQWGMPIDQAEQVSDCMYDWVTPGDLKSLNGAKADDYARLGLPQRPTYKPFDSFDEVELVMGMDLLDKAHPNWRDSFTLWSGGPLNVNEAPAELIAAVFSLNPKQVELFTSARNGRDGIPGTADDVPVQNLTALEGLLGLSSTKVSQLGAQVSFSDPNRRIDSVGTAGGMQVSISVVTRLNSSPIQYFLWSEQ